MASLAGADAKLELRRVDCARCGGSGSYSFNLVHGDRCYGCGGRGFVLKTERQLREKERRLRRGLERERARDAEHAAIAERRRGILDRVAALWPHEFDQFPAEWRHQHYQQKAERLLHAQGVRVRSIDELGEHFGLLRGAA